jgi:hypothetical protein
MSVRETCQAFIERKKRQFERDRDRKKRIGMKDIGRKGRFYFVREAWTLMQQHNLPEKVFVLERLRRLPYEGRLAHGFMHRDGDIEYRIGYFIVGRNGKRKGKWVWGQFCPLIPSPDLKRLLQAAEREQTIQ